MPEIYIDFNQHELFDDETKEILTAVLLQARDDSNKLITLSRKKDFPKTVVCEKQTYSVTLSHSINLYPTENGELQFEVLGHTADPRYTAAKMRSKDIVSYTQKSMKVSSVDGVLRKAFETVVIKKVILQGQMNGGDLTLVEPSQPRVHKSQKIALKGEFLPKVRDDIFYQAANEVDINSQIYPDISPLLFKQQTNEPAKNTQVIKSRFSMPYLAGKTFGQILDEYKDKSSKPIPFEKILQIINAFLKAMKQLEEQGVVHCDLHPNNVLFDEQEQVAHIIDFDNAFLEGTSIIPTKHAARYVAFEVREAMQTNSRLEVTQANHIYSVARIVHDLIYKTTTIGFIQKIEEQIINLKTNLLTPGLSESLEKRPALDAWISFFENIQQDYEKVLQEQTQEKLSSEIDKVLQLDEPLSYEADLDLLHALLKQEIDKSGNHNKLDRKKTYACQSEDGLKIIKLSHSIVKHRDAAGNVFYDVYARDHDIDGEKIRYANATIGAAKKNVLGIGGFGKVKPIMGRFFEQNGKLVQISHPGLVTKIIREHPSSKLKDYEQEASIASKSYRAVSEILQRQGKKGVQIFDYVMPYFPGSNVDQLAFKPKKWIFRKEFIQNLDIVIASCEAVKTFHKEIKCLHGDIKPENICYDLDTKTAFLIDLGEREYLLGEELNGLTMIHTKKFAAPEIKNSDILFSIEINEKIDIYSLGVTIDYLLNGKITKGKYNEKTQFHMLPYADEITNRKNGKALFKFLQKMRCKDSEERPDIDEVITFFSALRVAYSRKNSDKQIETNNNDLRAVYGNPDIYIKKLETLAKNIDEVLLDIEKEKNRFAEESHYLKTDKYHAFKIMHEHLEAKKIEIEENVKIFKSDLNKIENQVFTTEAKSNHQELYNNCKSFFESSIKTTIRIVSLKTKGNDLIGKHTNALWQEERTNFVWKFLRKIFAGLIKTDSAKTLIKAESNFKEIDPDVVVDDMNQPDPTPTPFPTYPIG